MIRLPNISELEDLLEDVQLDDLLVDNGDDLFKHEREPRNRKKQREFEKSLRHAPKTFPKKNPKRHHRKLH